MTKVKDISKWLVEIEYAEKYKRDNFGAYSEKEHYKMGECIDFFERGYSNFMMAGLDTDNEIMMTLNLIHAVVKNIVPAVRYQNPKILVFPKKIESQNSSPLVAATLNHFYSQNDAEEVNEKLTWDAYVLGHGYYKVGYSTQFGQDIEDDDKKKLSLVDKTLIALKLKQPEETNEKPSDINLKIISENPYIMYISPFDFGKDPRAKTLEESMYWYHKVRRTVKYMKDNKKFKNTKDLKGSVPEDIDLRDVSQGEMEDFKTVDLYEIHYRNAGRFYLIYISQDGQVFEEHYHEESIYDMDEWQCDELTFNKHGHNAYAISDVAKITPLQERFNNVMVSILDQMDRMVPKLAFDEGGLTPEGENALTNGDIGAKVKCSKNPNEVFKELNFVQFKTDLKAFAMQIIDIVSIMTGITKSQLLGVSSADTATDAQISQGGYTLRVSDMNRAVNRFSKKQARKYWKVIRQFVDLDKLELINGQKGADPETGAPLYNWLTISPEVSEQMQVGDYDFDIEVGSTQKNDLAVVRKQFENFINIVSRREIVTILQEQGYQLMLPELAKSYLKLFPEVAIDPGNIIRKITPGTTGLITPELPSTGQGGTTPGSTFNQLERQHGQPTPTVPSELSV